MARNTDVVNTGVSQAELAALQCELFAAAREALHAARESGTIPAALLTSAHQIIRDSGIRPDVEGVGNQEDKDADGVISKGFSPNWLERSTELIKDL